MIPVETLRPPPGPRPGQPGQNQGPGGSGNTQPRRMNALKQNNPAKDLLSTPKMGKIFNLHPLVLHEFQSKTEWIRILTELTFELN